MSCFVIEICSIGGCPLEEACEHFSLNNKIIALLCSGYIFFAYFVFSVSFLRLGIALQVKSITSGIIALSRARWDLQILANFFLARDVFRRL